MSQKQQAILKAFKQKAKDAQAKRHAFIFSRRLDQAHKGQLNDLHSSFWGNLSWTPQALLSSPEVRGALDAWSEVLDRKIFGAESAVSKHYLDFQNQKAYRIDPRTGRVRKSG